MEAVNKLIEMFKSKEFSKCVAMTVIKRREGDHGKPSDKWSIGNHIIMYVIGETQDARTYKQWQEVGRHVKKGSKAFNIYAPILKTFEDEETGEKESHLIGFRAMPVFKVEATDGKKIEVIDYSPKILPPLFGVADKLGIQVEYKPLSAGLYGFYSDLNRKITLGSEDAIVYFHELAHGVNATFSDMKDTVRAEIIAEVVAGALCQLQGINGYDKEVYEYVKSYCKGTDDKQVVKTVLGVLNDVEKIINIILDAENK